ncbi:unnamed protein product [Lactuca virosa]|uniref:Uncharacterized protein n=1 Tax=Lactuca virosa TaxID=75947 RepID=A0AAU9LSI6_9ASTR|nr:unnamed protein product [Lactuca virosa]
MHTVIFSEGTNEILTVSLVIRVREAVFQQIHISLPTRTIQAALEKLFKRHKKRQQWLSPFVLFSHHNVFFLLTKPNGDFKFDPPGQYEDIMKRLNPLYYQKETILFFSQGN